ncbi:MAG: hypothetical protein ABJC04_08605, partial [Verrucomicrobiota bacterium]
YLVIAFEISDENAMANDSAFSSEKSRDLENKPYPTVTLTVAWDGSEVSYPDPKAFLTTVRRMPEYQTWLKVKDDHTFKQTNAAGYRFAAHFVGMGINLGSGPEELVLSADIFRPDGSCLATTPLGTANPQRWDTKVFDATGTNVTVRLQWTRDEQPAGGFVERVVHLPGTANERMWFANRFNVVYSDALEHRLPQFIDAPYKSSPATSAKALAESPKLQFLASIERTVNDIDEKIGNECLALESGELVGFNEAEIKALPKGEQQKWFDDRGVNVLMDTVGGKRGLGLRNVTATLVSNDAWNWENVSDGHPRNIRSELEAAVRPDAPGVAYKDRSGFRWHLIPTNAPLPMTFALRTSAGRLGILQILTFTDDPGGVKIRYKLLQQNVKPSSAAEETSGDKTSQPLSFGSVIERELYSVSTQRPIKGQDIDNAIEVEVPENIEKSKEEVFFQWTAEHGIDLMAFIHKKHSALWTSLKLVSAEAELWEKSDAAKIDSALKSGALNLKLGESMILSGFRTYDITGLELPQTLVFQTVAGNRGVLQITGFTENPRGVKIRYKLAAAVEFQLPHTHSTGQPPPPGLRREIEEKERLIAAQPNSFTNHTRDTRVALAEAEATLAKSIELQKKNEISEGEFAINRERVGLITAELTGDPVKIANAKVRYAEANLIRAAEWRQINGITEEEFKATKDALADRRSELEMAIQTVKNSTKFGQVFERLLQDPSESRTNCFIDFETGALPMLPAEIKLTDRAAVWEWAKAQDVDAIVDTKSQDVRGLLGYDLTVTRLSDEQWEQSPALGQMNNLVYGAKWNEKRFGVPPMSQAMLTVNSVTTDPKPSKTWLFLTRKGTLGILQFLDYNDSPRGNVKIRYKLAQQKSVAPVQFDRTKQPVAAHLSRDNRSVMIHHEGSNLHYA